MRDPTRPQPTMSTFTGSLLYVRFFTSLRPVRRLAVVLGHLGRLPGHISQALAGYPRSKRGRASSRRRAGHCTDLGWEHRLTTGKTRAQPEAPNNGQ